MEDSPYLVAYNVPPPPEPVKLGALPFWDMKPGASFLVPTPKGLTPLELQSRICARIHRFKKAHAPYTEWTTEIRTLEAHKEEGVRVWRRR